ncbi:MAG: YgcG family protein [Bacteroidota bacterium]|nr:YgcG family protein [Bacteroidota bacterium]
MSFKKQSFLFIFLFAAVTMLALPSGKIPSINQRVTDLTGTLSDYDIKLLESDLAKFEQTKGSQVAVLIIPTTGGLTIEDYSMQVVEQWKLGREAIDDGVLLLVAKNDRTLRIEVGYGLEGAIPDAVASRIINEYIVPDFKNGDFAGGINQGVRKIMNLINGEQLPPVEYSSKSRELSSDVRYIGQLIMLFSFLLGFIVMLFLTGSNIKRFLTGLGIIVLLMGIGAVLSAFLHLFGILTGVIVVVSLIFRGLVLVVKKEGLHTGGSYSSSSWSSSSSSWSSGSSFSSGSSYSSGSSFSGGGGSFGGGGASGSW